jgi:hypothetical protein
MAKIQRLPLLPLFFVFSVVYLILAMHLPVSLRTGSIHDDALYWGNAHQIVKGHWLGEYGQMTLAKGPGFPLFLAINAILGIPVTLSVALLYLFSCLLITNTLYKTGLNKYLVLTIFIVILLHPEVFPTIIIRDNIYPALSLIMISGVIQFLFAPPEQEFKLSRILPYGLVLGLFWITREEGIWIVPGLLCLLFLKALQLKKQNAAIKSIFYRFAYFLLIATLFVSLIASINYFKYGKFEVVDFKGQAFSQALKSLNSVDVGEDIAYLPVSSAKRQAIYKVSPSFSQLKDFFEYKGNMWAAFGCPIYPQTCGDYAGGWFMWALRDAVALQGYYKNSMLAAEFYNNISKEIETACDIGTIKCKTNPVPFMPNITMAQLTQLPEKINQALKLVMVQLPLSPVMYSGYSGEPLEQLQKVRRFLGNPRTTLALSEQTTELTGWYYSVNPNEWIVLNCSAVNKTKISRGVQRINSPDIAEKFQNPNANLQRFVISVPTNEDCSISVDILPSSNISVKALLEKQKTDISLGNNGILYIDNIVQINDNIEHYLPLKLKNLLAHLYKLIIPILVLLGAVTYFIYLILTLIGKIAITDTFIVTTTIWCLLFTRIFLLVLVDISSFPAINNLYMLVAFPLLCIAAFLSLQLIVVNSTKPHAS